MFWDIQKEKCFWVFRIEEKKIFLGIKNGLYYFFLRNRVGEL